eukprot:1315908-Amorphochlora_amoeboformis.AAC.3
MMELRVKTWMKNYKVRYKTGKATHKELIKKSKHAYCKTLDISLFITRKAITCGMLSPLDVFDPRTLVFRLPGPFPRRPEFGMSPSSNHFASLSNRLSPSNT